MKEEISARLVVHGLPEMKGVELRRFRKWLLKVADELRTEDPKVFAKTYRATLYK